jgi:hypothetical protein
LRVRTCDVDDDDDDDDDCDDCDLDDFDECDEDDGGELRLRALLVGVDGFEFLIAFFVVAFVVVAFAFVVDDDDFSFEIDVLRRVIRVGGGGGGAARVRRVGIGRG